MLTQTVMDKLVLKVRVFYDRKRFLASDMMPWPAEFLQVISSEWNIHQASTFPITDYDAQVIKLCTPIVSVFCVVLKCCCPPRRATPRRLVFQPN